MTPQEIKITFKYLEDILSVTNQIHQDKEHDSKELFEMYKELMLAISSLITENKLLIETVKQYSKSSNTTAMQAASAVALETKDLKDVIENKEVLALNPDKINKKRPWYKKLKSWWERGWE